MRKVLFVDDEPNVLQGLRRMLRPMRSEWDMHFVDSAEAAIEAIRSESFDVVVTDMRMPVMDGAQLLNEVMEADPKIARIVLSGQTDQEAALRSACTAHQFLAKPCDTGTLKDAVQRACQLRGLLADGKLVSVATGLGTLPSVPDVYAELTREMGSEDVSIKRVGEIISKDVAMTAKILQLVNSAFFGLPRTVQDAEEAVTYLGTDVIRGLVLSHAAFEIFDADCAGFSIKALWQHSLTVGALARDIAKLESAGKATIDEALIAGMLHDVGQLILAAAIPEKYGEALTLAIETNVPLREAEYSKIGCGHSEVGAYLMGLWGLPDGVIEAIAFHDKPDRCPMTQMTPLIAVHAANALVHQCTDDESAHEAELCMDAIAAIGCEQRIEAWTQLVEQSLTCEDAA